MILIYFYNFRFDKIIEYNILNSNHVINDIYNHFRLNKYYVVQLEIVVPNIDTYNNDKVYIISDQYIFNKSKVSKMTFLKFIFDSIKSSQFNHKIFSINSFKKWIEDIFDINLVKPLG